MIDAMLGNWKPAVAMCLAFALTVGAAAALQRLGSPAEYKEFIDPLLEVKDFGTSYFDDGATNNSVLFPSKDQAAHGMPADPVIELIRLGPKGLPILIDCLADGRISTARFEGSATTRAMNVPVGYVCLDILLGSARGRHAKTADCADAGLGACIDEGFYFRPDDYYRCWKGECSLRPWVRIVHRNWRQAYLQKQLRFENPYDHVQIEEYRQFATPKK